MDKVLDSTILSSVNRKKGILAIGAHPDNMELGCGASLARLAQKGTYIVTIMMTTGNSGVDGIINRHEESRSALKILGCHQAIHLNFAGTRARLQLSDMIPALKNIMRNRIPSDVEVIRVYTMHDADRHQDHLAVYQASMVACRAIPQIPDYGTPGTWLSFMPQVFESVKEEYLSFKLAALKEHKNQSQRDYMRLKHLHAIAQSRG